jgi:Flp pilus assembly pilin Flp
MEFLKRLVVEEEGQGLVEYTLIVLLVALVFWVAIRSANVGPELTSAWGNVTACLGAPLTCAGS